jgi:hypothetical protein
MFRRLAPTLAAALLFLAPAASHAALTTYAQTFEGLVQADPSALGNNGWKVFANVFSPDGSTYYYGYGPFPAPNNAGGFCGLDVNQGGYAQGTQQLVVYSDYNNADHGVGNRIESNTFQERTIAAGDVGQTWVFRFDAKKGNLESPTTALAFIKTLDPNNGYAMTNFITADMTSIPATWGSHSLSITITPALSGQILQFGFANTASNYKASGIFYDNVSFALDGTAVPASGPWGLLALALLTTGAGAAFVLRRRAAVA